MLTCEIEGSFNFRGTTLYCSITMEYDRNGYLNVTELKAGISEKADLREVSDRMRDHFQDANWNALYASCIQHENDCAEMMRDSRRDNRRTHYAESAPGIPDTLAEKYERFDAA